MTLVIEVEDKLYAEKIDPTSFGANSSHWVGKHFEPLQGSVMRYDRKTFRNHKHILNPRIIKRTQEAFIVVRGSIGITIFHEKSKVELGYLEAKAGEAIFIWDGYHEIEFLEEDTIAYEIKSGQFTTISEDKEFYD